MSKSLKVYGWGSYKGNRYMRRVVAAPSKADAYRVIGHRPEIVETGNAAEISAAMTRPGVIFESPGDYAKEKKWTALP